MEIRLAKPDDSAMVSSIIKKYRTFYEVENQDDSEIADFVNERFRLADSKIFIAVENEVIAGFIQLYPSYSTVSLKRQWILNDFYVEEKYRNKGTGKALMDAVTDYFKDSAKGFILVTDKTNTTAKKFYDKYGWDTGEYDFYTYFY